MNQSECRVSEKDINAAINDFTVFLSFMDEKKPVLSKRMDWGRMTCSK
jgi:hypothetical protein